MSFNKNFFFSILVLYLWNISPINACVRDHQSLKESIEFAKRPTFATTGMLIADNDQMSSGVLIRCNIESTDFLDTTTCSINFL